MLHCNQQNHHQQLLKLALKQQEQHHRQHHCEPLLSQNKNYQQSHHQQHKFQQQQQQQQQQHHQQQQKPAAVLRVQYIRVNSKDGSWGNGAKMKTIAPNIRRRRRCDRHHLELYRDAQTSHAPAQTKSAGTSPISELVSGLPAPPITPPPAFISVGYKRSSSHGATVKRSLGEQQTKFLTGGKSVLAKKIKYNSVISKKNISKKNAHVDYIKNLQLHFSVPKSQWNRKLA